MTNGEQKSGRLFQRLFKRSRDITPESKNNTQSDIDTQTNIDTQRNIGRQNDTNEGDIRDGDIASNDTVKPLQAPGSETGHNNSVSDDNNEKNNPDTSKAGWLKSLRHSLKRSSDNLTGKISALISKRRLDNEVMDELEELLLAADLGLETTERIIDRLRQEKFAKDISSDEITQIVAAEITTILQPVAVPLTIDAGRPLTVILIVGVNGVGKTTTIGKLTARFKNDNKKVIIAAGDTFRAAAVEQLKIWGERNQCPVINGSPGANPASVIFDAVETAKRDGYDVLLIDTAGRLQNKAELMAELTKITRVITKHIADAPHHVLLVLDATTGQNALNQVDLFADKAKVNGLVMTKIDGTAKGGILVAIAARYKLPVHYLGMGEKITDLSPFTASEFAAAIVGRPDKYS